MWWQSSWSVTVVVVVAVVTVVVASSRKCELGSKVIATMVLLWRPVLF